MPPAKAQHSRTARTARERMQRDDRCEQNGNRTMLHGLSIPRLLSSVA